MAQTVTTEHILQELKKRKVSKLFQIAEKYGIVHRGFSANDYLRYAVKNNGWESTAINGIKGSAKSNLMWQRGYSVYQNHDTVREHVVTNREQLIDMLATTERIPWIGIDDIGALFPRNLYFTHRKLYSKLSETWETVRTKINCLDFTATRKNKVATFIVEDITADVICYNRYAEIKSHYDYQRWMWLRSLKDPIEMIAKSIRIEDIPFPLTPEAFKYDKELSEGKFIVGGVEYIGEDFFKNHAFLFGIPRNEFVKYWEDRLALTQRAYGEFKQLFVKENPPTDTEASKAAQVLVSMRKDRRATS